VLAADQFVPTRSEAWKRWASGFGSLGAGAGLVDAVTAFFAAQGARFVVRRLGGRRLVNGPLGSGWHDPLTVEPVGPHRAGDAVGAAEYEESSDGPVPGSDVERELTLDELIAGDPGGGARPAGLGIPRAGWLYEHRRP
jgi:hypothetical protein